MYKEAWLAK